MLFSKQTPAAGGTAFAQFDAAWCYDGNGYILNDTGTSLDVRIGSSGSVQTLASGATLPIKLVFSMAELYVRRTDQSTTQVTVEAQIGTGSADGGTTPVQAGAIAALAAAAAVAGVTLPPVLHAQVGDVFQLFYFDVARGSDSISCRCDIGSAYSRYFEVTPSAGSIGDHTLMISIHAPDGGVLKTASTVLRVSAAPSNPAGAKNVAIFGDSLTASGGWSTEFIRRLKGTGGTPVALGLSNLNFVGEGIAAETSGYGITGYGGWRWGYFSGLQGAGYVARSSHDKTAVDVGSYWTNGGNSFSLVSVNSPAPFAELATNGGFETWAESVPDDWDFQNIAGGVLTSSSAFVHSGVKAAKIARPNASLWHAVAMSKIVSVEAGRIYDVRAFVAGSGVFAAYALDGTTGYAIDPTGFFKTANAYSELEFQFTAPTDTTRVGLYFAPDERAGSVLYLDDVSVCDVTPTSLKFLRMSGSGDLPATGTLAHQSGATHTASITFTASHSEPPTPLWNAQKAVVDIATWGGRKTSGGVLDHIIIELGWNEWNNLYSGGTEPAVSEFLSQIEDGYPDAKIWLVGMANPSPTGGLGANYGADIDLSSYEFSRKFARDYDALIRSKAVGGIEYVPIYPVVDSVHAYPESAVPVNSRSAETEMRGTNGVHPENGYSQIADAVYRQFSSGI